MRGNYITIPAVLLALGAGGTTGCGRTVAPVAARPLPAREIARNDLAYIIKSQRAGKSYGRNRQEHPLPTGGRITDGFTFLFDAGKARSPVGTVISPPVGGVERIVFCEGNIALVDTSADGGVDRIVVAGAPYDPRNPSLNPTPTRNIHPREGGFPPDVADAYLASLAAVVAEAGRKEGGHPAYVSSQATVKKFEAARKAFMAALNPPAPTPPSP
jgi:hypothetical protein